VNFSRDLNVKYSVTRNALKSQSGARVRILFDGQETLAELKAADPGRAHIIFKSGSSSRHRHVLSDKEVDELFQERAGILASRVSLRSLVGANSEFCNHLTRA